MVAERRRSCMPPEGRAVRTVDRQSECAMWPGGSSADASVCSGGRAVCLACEARGAAATRQPSLPLRCSKRHRASAPHGPSQLQSTMALGLCSAVA